VKGALRETHLSTDSAFLERYPHELNMGAIQRVCMARALILAPSLLVADEPTSSLDPSVQAKVLKLLLDLQVERGLTMLFVTHDIGLARKISDRIGVMFDGRFVEVGPAARIVAAPAHPYTRLLMESVRGVPAGMNRVLGAGEAEGACPFLPRCPDSRKRCREEAPRLAEHGDRRLACHYPVEG
jgi:peptide/nickel transport system ATP-binding protein